WAPLYMGAIAAGALCCAASYVFAVKTGHMTFVNVPARRWFSAAITACLAFALAPLQEIAFRAYLLTLARDWLGAWASVVLTALLFALTIELHWDHLTVSPSKQGLLIGAFLGGALLSMMRLYHGSLVAPVGAVTGWVFVQILVQRTKIVAPASTNSAVSEWP